MALLLITGVAGTGKTLYCIQKYIIPELKAGGTVYTNIDGLINKRLSILFDIDIFTIEKNLITINDCEYFYKDVPKNSLFVLDEAQNVFNNRDWQAKKNNECISYLMEHRHYGHKIIMITPHIDSLDAGIRRVAEFTYKHKSFSALGNAKTVKCAVFDQSSINKSPIQTFQWKHDSRVYDCYKSYFDEGTIEKKPRVYPLRNTALYIIVTITFVSLFFGIKNTYEFSKKFKKKSETKQISNKINVNQRKINVIKINDSVIYSK
jgi:zona occludens toxin (predicted ATPase)